MERDSRTKTPRMSGNRLPQGHEHPAQRLDARARKSRDALGDALISLMQEKPFADIIVQEVLDRAGVSRSTFYHHFRDKEDLFTSDAGDFFHALANALIDQGDRSDRIFPVQEFLEHVATAKDFVDGLRASGLFHDNMDLARGHFARGIERRLAGLGRAGDLPPERRVAVATGYAGMIISLLGWWIDDGMRSPPEELDALFHRMVWAGLTAPVSVPERPWV